MGKGSGRVRVTVRECEAGKRERGEGWPTQEKHLLKYCSKRSVFVSHSTVNDTLTENVLIDLGKHHHPQQMQALENFRKKWLEVSNNTSDSIVEKHRKELEDQMFHLFLQMDSIVPSQLDAVETKLNNLQQTLNMKNDELIRNMNESYRFERD